MLATALLAVLLAAAPQPPAPPAPAPARAASGPATPTPELRARVRSLLGAIHRPVPAESFRELGPAAAIVLDEIASSGAEVPFVRARAVDALSRLGGEAATATTLRIARAPGEAWDVRASAVRGLGRLLPEDRLVGELRPLLERDPEAHVREAAATVLARKAGASGCAAVRAQATRESRPGRVPYATALQRCR